MTKLLVYLETRAWIIELSYSAVSANEENMYVETDYAPEARKASIMLRNSLCGRAKNESLKVTECDIPMQRSACSELRKMIEKTVLDGEKNSVLILGPQGSGKSWVVEKTLKELKVDAKCRGRFTTVYLNGIIHTDDRLALLEIAHQLQVAMTDGAELHLSYAALLEFLIEAVESGNEGSKSVIFVIDSLDLFTQHKNQMLLCNLFDFTRSASVPVAIIGLTRRLDVIEILEKRLRSRYSHRQIFLSCNYSFEEYLQMCKVLLTLPDSFNNMVYKKLWDHHVEDLLMNFKVKTTLRNQYDFSSNIQALKALLMLPICQLGLTASFLSPEHIVVSFLYLNEDAVKTVLHSVSVLELCLVIAMKHLVTRKGIKSFNFEMVYDDFLSIKASEQSDVIS